MCTAPASGRCRFLRVPWRSRWRGPGYALVRRTVDVFQGPVTVTLPRMAFPGKWWSGDLHVHTNYGGRYRNTPANLAKQARADIHPYATTSPIYVIVAGRPRRSRAAATWALQWLDRLEKATADNPDYRTREERAGVLRDISRARAVYQSCSAGAPR